MSQRLDGDLGSFANGGYLLTAQNRGSADSHSIDYRRDIDGLRALAIASVVLFHLAPKVLPSGFLGVDLFFVLSGFLITGIIFRQAVEGSFSYSRFYERRIRRIMPALVVVLIVCSLACTALMLPIDLVGFAKSLVATLAFVANIFFWRDSNYFSAAAETKPLLHMWSLGVEEQFYIVAPLVIAFLVRKAPRILFPTLLVLFLASLWLNLFAVQVGAANPAFYLLPTRAWELAAGAALAVRPVRFAAGDRGTGLVALLGLALIVVSLATPMPIRIAPIPAALPVIIGTVMVIWANEKPGAAYRILSLDPLVKLGLISFSLYLWHWPIIVLMKYWLIRDLDLVETLIAVAVMLALSAASWRYVEAPFRSKAMSRPVVYRTLGATSAAILAMGALLIWSRGLPQRLPADAARINAVAGTHFRCAVADYIVLGHSRACALALPSRNPSDADVVLMGNSHAQMYAPLVAQALEARQQHGLLVNANACIPSRLININKQCFRIAGAYMDQVKNLPRVATVIVALEWHLMDKTLIDSSGNPQKDTQGALIAGIDDTIEQFHRANKRVILIGPIAVPGWEIASVMSRELAFGRPASHPAFASRADFDAGASRAIEHFSNRSDIVFARPDSVQCDASQCDYMHDGVPLFSDSNHLAVSQLVLFRPVFEDALAKAKNQE